MLSSAEAVTYVLDNTIDTTLYSISNSLTYDNIKVTPIMLSNYKNSKHVMSQKVAKRFYDYYGIEIGDSQTHLGRGIL